MWYDDSWEMRLLALERLSWTLGRLCAHQEHATRFTGQNERLARLEEFAVMGVCFLPDHLSRERGSNSRLIHDVERCFGGAPEMRESCAGHHLADSSFAGLRAKAESDFLRAGAGCAEERRE